MEGSAGHGERAEEHIAGVPDYKRKGDGEPEEREVGGRVSPGGDAATAGGGWFLRRKIGFGEFGGVVARGYHG